MSHETNDPQQDHEAGSFISELRDVTKDEDGTIHVSYILNPDEPERIIIFRDGSEEILDEEEISSLDIFRMVGKKIIILILVLILILSAVAPLISQLKGLQDDEYKRTHFFEGTDAKEDQL